MKTYKIHFIRHGLTEGAILGRYIGHTDEPLSAEGAAQLEALRRDCVYPHAEAVISSPLSRCIQTAAILYPDNEPAVIRDFIECDFGEFEGLSAESLLDYPEFGEWLKGGREAAPPHGESSEAFGNRIYAAFISTVDGLFNSGIDSVAIITHGGVIAALMSAFGIPELPMHEWMTPCGCGYTVSITPSLWQRIYKFEVLSDLPEDYEDYEVYEEFLLDDCEEEEYDDWDDSDPI